MNEICLSCKKHTKCGRAIHETIGCSCYTPMTNEEWLNSLSTQEKSTFIAMFTLRRKFVDIGEFYESVKESLINACELPEMPVNLRKSVEEWLKEEHHEQ